MANHLIYDNFYLSNEIEDQLLTRLNLQAFCRVDNSLVGTPGMTVKVNVYSATDGTEKLEMGEGNTKSIDVSYAQKDYKILLAQNRFEWYDEQEMTDPMLLETGVRHASTDMLNTITKDIYAEFSKASQTVTASAPDFNAFVDASALLGAENIETLSVFAFLHPKDMASVRKTLKDDLKYVEAFARSGYVGSVAGVNLYATNAATQGTITGGTRDAVTVFNKRGVEIERITRNLRDADDANVRKNTMFTRKYYLAALTDETKAFKITLSA